MDNKEIEDSVSVLNHAINDLEFQEWWTSKDSDKLFSKDTPLEVLEKLRDKLKDKLD